MRGCGAWNIVRALCMFACTRRGIFALRWFSFGFWVRLYLLSLAGDMTGTMLLCLARLCPLSLLFCVHTPLRIRCVVVSGYGIHLYLLSFSFAGVLSGAGLRCLTWLGPPVLLFACTDRCIIEGRWLHTRYG